MEMLKKYDLSVDADIVANAVKKIKTQALNADENQVNKSVFTLIDLTTLTELDNEAKVKDMCQKVNGFKAQYADMNNVAAICVYPSMVPYVKKHLQTKNVGIASVGGGFPASQTFTEIKVQECAMAVKAGATEIDIVIPVGEFVAGNDELLFNETKQIKEAIGEAHLKVILETGDLTPEQIRRASILAMEAGADFIKTSTGKVAVSATHEAMYIMCSAIKDYHEQTGRMVGIKPAGGIREPKDAAVYYEIVNQVLGSDWTNNEWFRIGASSLANSLLQEIYKTEESYF